jgi:glycosyltransferase involved in cell wall biosynthesis
VFKQHGYSYFDPVPDPYELASFDAVVFLTRASYEYNRMHRHSFESSVEIIPNPIDGASFRPASAEERLAARDEFDLPPEAAVVTTVARQVPKKGAHILIECWRQVVERYPRAILWVVGPVTPAAYEARLREAARLSGLEWNVRFQGAVAPEMVPRVLWASDVFVFPGLCHEGMPLALLQGMSCGLPCIASRWSEVEEVMAGLSVEWVAVPNSPVLWAEAVRRTIGSLPRGEPLTRNQWQLVQERYGEERILERWREFYRNQIELARGAG